MQSQSTMANNALLINGSLCLTDIVEKAKAGHSAFTKGKNGKIYFNFTEWVNETPNEFGQHSSYQLNSTKEKKADELAQYGKCYIGNGKKSEGGGGEPPSTNDVADATAGLDDLPF